MLRLRLRLFPEVSPVVIAADALVAGTQQGIGDFAYDVGAT